MKKTSIKWAGILLLSIMASFQQQAQNSNAINGDPTAPGTQATVSCSTDTLDYAFAKSQGIERFTLQKGDVEGVAQWFEYPSPITIEGVTILSGVETTSGVNKSVNLRVLVYGSTNDSLPTGVPLTTAFVTVDTNFQSYRVPFISPVALQGDYLVAVEYGAGITETDTLAVGFSLQGDGDQESLPAAQITNSQGSIWLGLENTLVNNDRDFFFSPWVGYDLTADFNPPADTVCVNDVLLFENQSTPLSGHRMYNLRIYDSPTYGNAYDWNLGDGTMTSDTDPNHEYTSTGAYSVVLTTQIEGYYTSCSEPIVRAINVEDRPTAMFASSTTTAAVGDTLTFTDMTVGGANCQWTFGDGDTINACGDQMHIYDSAGVYNVVLEVTSPYGCIEEYTETITISPLLSRDLQMKSIDFQVWPNPSSGQVHFKWAGTGTEDAEVTIWSQGGRAVKTFKHLSGSETLVNLSDLPAGMYIARFTTANVAVHRKLVIN